MIPRNKRELKKMGLLAEVANSYYVQHKTQAEIAERFYLSRSRVARLLQEALDSGVVEIQVKINYPFERHYEFEERFQEWFSIKEAYIFNTYSMKEGGDSLKEQVASLAADVLRRKIKKDMIVGISWGQTLERVIYAIGEQPPLPIEVVQLLGAVNCKHSCTPQEMVAALSRAYGGNAVFLNAPLLVKNPASRRVYLEDASNQKAVNMAGFADLALMGIVDMQRVKRSELWQGSMDEAMYLELQEKGAAGAICGRFYDSEGAEVDCEWNRTCMSISAKELRAIPNRIAVVDEEQKAGAVIGAIRGGYINTLVTDTLTAKRMIQIDKNRQ